MDGATKVETCRRGSYIGGTGSTVAAALLVLSAGSVAMLCAAPPGPGLVIDGKFVSTATSGPPLEVSSPSVVLKLNADLLDGRHASQLQPPQSVIEVGESGTAFTSIQAAIDSIVDPCTTGPYLIRVGPGTYLERVTMAPCVDIEGSGQGVTTITDGTNASQLSGTVMLASDAELRRLTVESTGSSDAVAIFGGFAVTARIVQVAASASGGSGLNIGVRLHGSATLDEVTSTASGGTSAIGIYIDSSSEPVLTSVVALAEEASDNNQAIRVTGSSAPMMIRVTATAIASATSALDAAAYIQNGSDPEIHHSSFSGLLSLLTEGTGTSVSVANTLLDGVVAGAPGGRTCVGAFNAAFQLLGSTCT